MVAQVQARVLAPLTNALVLVAEPRAALVDDVALDRHVKQRAFAADAFAVHNVELCHAERRSNLVLDNLDLRVVADDFAAVFERRTSRRTEA